MAPEERRAYAERMFVEQPELCPVEHREAILRGTVTLGMTPFEAHLAGGTFTYEVAADRRHWPPHTNPLAVMWRQSVAPDDSRIVMHFANATQFAEQRAFTVRFRGGRAIAIEAGAAAGTGA